MGASLESLLGFLPLILLVVSLLRGRYPGEEIVARFARRSRPAMRQTGFAPSRPRQATTAFKALLQLACSRPLRGPPLSSHALT
jgi:hypothetical protein